MNMSVIETLKSYLVTDTSADIRAALRESLEDGTILSEQILMVRNYIKMLFQPAQGARKAA